MTTYTGTATSLSPGIYATSSFTEAASSASNSAGGEAFYATSNNSSTSDGTIYAINNTAGNAIYAINSANNGTAIVGIGSVATGSSSGICGKSYNSGGYGGVFQNTAGGVALYTTSSVGVGGLGTIQVANTGSAGSCIAATGSGNGIIIGNTGTNCYGLYVSSTGSGGYSGYFNASGGGGAIGLFCNGTTGLYATGGTAAIFNAPVTCNGYITKSGGGFRIDNPLEPEKSFLNHEFVESDSAKNTYSGNVILDAKGEATITMESWFSAINSEVSMTLSAQGKSMPNLFWSEVDALTFKISGGVANGKVSWQIVAVRSDAWQKKNGKDVVLPKNKEQAGRFMNPELFGKDDSCSVEPITRAHFAEKQKQK
jgi:hypothetical protein